MVGGSPLHLIKSLVTLNPRQWGNHIGYEVADCRPSNALMQKAKLSSLSWLATQTTSSGDSTPEDEQEGGVREEYRSGAAEGRNTIVERASTEKVPWSDAYSCRRIGGCRLVSMPASSGDVLIAYGTIHVRAKICRQSTGCLTGGRNTARQAEALGARDASCEVLWSSGMHPLGKMLGQTRAACGLWAHMSGCL